jgi:hypothetical protein
MQNLKIEKYGVSTMTSFELNEVMGGNDGSPDKVIMDMLHAIKNAL